MAVIMKLEEVLRMETCVVEVPRARALVKRAHIMPLKIKLRPKKICEEWYCLLWSLCLSCNRMQATRDQIVNP